MRCIDLTWRNDGDSITNSKLVTLCVRVGVQLNSSAKTPTLDPWLGVVVSLADGQHTIQQLIEHLAGQYNGAPPQELDRTIEYVIERLTETEVLKLAEQAVILPYYLYLNLSDQV